MADETYELLHEDPVIFRRRWFLLGIMCLSLVMVVMSVAGLNVALPNLQSDLEATASELELGPQLSAGGTEFVRVAKPAGTPVKPTTTRNVLPSGSSRAATPRCASTSPKAASSARTRSSSPDGPW